MELYYISLKTFWSNRKCIIAFIKKVVQLYCSSITLMINDSGVFSIEKLARGPNTSGADQCFGWFAVLSRTSKL